MNADQNTAWRFICVHLRSSAVLLFLIAGCAKPDKANIALRKQVQTLESEVADLKRQREGDRATIRALESQRTTVPSLPAERLERIFTAHGLKIGRLTGGADTDAARPGDEVLRVYAVPTDQRADLLKAAGAFVIDAYDLSLPPNDNHLGRWEISAEQAAESWFGNAVMYGYTLTLPWQRAPQGERVTVRVTFTDSLTGRQFTEQKDVDVKPPAASPASIPTTAPATAPSAAR